MFDIYLLIFFSALGYAFPQVIRYRRTPLLDEPLLLGPQAENAIRESLTPVRQQPR